AALGRPDLDPRTAALGEEFRDRRRVPRVARNDDLRRDARCGPVVLEHERLDHRGKVLPAHVLQMEGVTVDHLAVAEREDLDDCTFALDGEPDHVDRPDRPPIRRLPLGEMLDAAEAVAISGRFLEALLGGGVPHLLVELALDRLRVAGKKLDHLVDDLSVALLRDVPHAGGQTAVDVVIEAGNAGVPPRLRPLARAVGEDTIEDVERLTHLLRVRVGPEVDDTAAVPLAREHDAGVLVLYGDRDVGKRLVVAQPDVERWPVTLDEVLLEMERLHLVLGHDHLDVGDPLGQLADRGPTVHALLEVGAHPRPQGLRLADVQHLARLVSKEVHPRPRGQGFQLIVEAGHVRASVATEAAAEPAGRREKRPGWRGRAAARAGSWRGRWRASRALPAARAWQHNPDCCQPNRCEGQLPSPGGGIFPEDGSG